jgi:hypothetical protein
MDAGTTSPGLNVRSTSAYAATRLEGMAKPTALAGV